MDNDAFRALVQERAKVKSTKEIARDAVEEEFRTRKKKRKRGGVSSSEDESDNDSDQEEPRKQDLLVPVAAKKKARIEDSKYRDRAKERREGKNIDYAAQSSLLEGVSAAADGEMDQVTMSQYLGGDEAHTHLVKGLDVALARRVKREMDKETNETGLEPASHSSPTAQVKKSLALVRNEDEARILLQRTKPESVSSELGRQMLSHMKSRHLPSSRDLPELTVRRSPAGYAIQRSILTFATTGDPRDRSRAWELPLESMHAASKPDLDVSETKKNGAITLDATLVTHILRAFSDIASTGRQDATGEATSKICDVRETEEEHEEKEDDDIFDDVDDYVPPTQPEKGSAVSESRAKATSGSIFAGLTAPKSPQPPSTVSSLPQPAVGQKEHKVLSRDVLGSMLSDRPSKPQMGVSIASYDGGYGEEMDVDFDGRFAAEDDGECGGKKKRKAKKTALQDDRER